MTRPPAYFPVSMSWFSRGDRPTNEIKQIASISGNTITFNSPLTISYRTSHQAELTPYTTDPNIAGHAANNRDIHVSNAGVEDLSIYGGADGGLRFKLRPIRGRKPSRSRNGLAKASRSTIRSG